MKRIVVNLGDPHHCMHVARFLLWLAAEGKRKKPNAQPGARCKEKEAQGSAWCKVQRERSPLGSIWWRPTKTHGQKIPGTVGMILKLMLFHLQERHAHSPSLSGNLATRKMIMYSSEKEDAGDLHSAVKLSVRKGTLLFSDEDD